MSTSTTNLHLTKPAANEHADIAIINANYDLIDEFAGTAVVDPDYVHTENNYTTTEKQKLEGLENYTLPTASSSTKGGVKVDNESISIDQSGTISAALSGLNEVNIDAVTLSDGQILKYDATSGKWVNASGGSGGSGHTILDDDGTALAQEDDLQIKGVYSTDNSEDGVTEVNVYREMTKAEFDLLSSDEKKGFIRVTDEPDIYSDGHFQPVIYSTEEREIGVWKDGKPLYQKTLVVANVGSVGSSITTPIQINDVPFDYIDVVDANIYDSNDNRRYNVPNLPKDTADRIFMHPYLNKSSNPVVFYLSLYSGGTTYSNMTDFNVTIQYTKSTDVAGSGTWTPQGVPVHHYSTDEQVIGTWIDGKTLYEKTWTNLNVTMVISGSGWQEISDVDLTGIDVIVDLKVWRQGGGGLIKNNNVAETGVSLNQKLQLAYNGDYGGTIKTITLQYTKTS